MSNLSEARDFRISLVNPQFPASFWDFSYCRDIDGSLYPFFPLALPTLAALSPQGSVIVIQDESVQCIDFEIDVDIVGITGFRVQEKRVFEIALAYKQRGRFVAIGGAVVGEDNLEECLRVADVVFLGEAENTWPEFLADVIRGKPSRIYRANGFSDLSCMPTPRFDLLRLHDYSMAIIETSRGCPQLCEFCEIPIKLGRKPRTKSPVQVMREIRLLASMGADSIFIIDDNFVGNRVHAREILRTLASFGQETGYRITFGCQITLDIAQDYEMLALLRAANIVRVFVGVESPRPAVLSEARKKQNLKQDMAQSLLTIQSYGFFVWGSLIVGWDADDKESFAEQFHLVQESAMPIVMVGILQAIPGTPLHERLKREDRLLDSFEGGIRSNTQDMLKTNIARPSGSSLSNADLISGYLWLVTSIYREDSFGSRLIKAILQGKNALNPILRNKKISWKEIMSLMRLVRYFLFGAGEPGRKMFLKVVSTTLLNNRGMLSQVLVSLAAYKHFSTFYHQIVNVSDDACGKQE